MAKGPSGDVAAALNRAIAAFQAGRLAEAESLCRLALGRDKRSFDALHLLGVIQASAGDFTSALATLDQALALNRRSEEALTNRGRVLNALGRHDEALASYDKALSLKRDHLNALHNRASTLLQLNRSAEALADFDRILALQPDFPLALHNRAIALNDLGRYADALATCNRLIELVPDNPEALHNRGVALTRLRQHDKAIADFEKAVRIDPDFAYARGDLLHARLHCCQWTGLEQDAELITAAVRAGKRADWPFSFLAVSDVARDQLACAKIFVADKHPAVPAAAALWRGERYAHDVIRVAYLSSDFREHAVGYLGVGLYELHDRARFNVIGVSFGPDEDSDMRRRMKAAFDEFIDVGARNDRAIAELIRAREIDIAVDLMGITESRGLAVLAHRPAPVAVNYLGYPGTVGADYIDYILADRIIIPPDKRADYAEKVVYLPDSYQVNDAKRRIAETTPSRTECGLPETGFVFCSFNNNFKLNPPIFDVWMRLLHAIEGSVLWLLAGNALVEGNLRREAQARGIAPERLVFAPRVKLADHLARHRLADLFLDTAPYGAHTTASDALWAGLPLVTCPGDAFASRVGASLLTAAGLPELIAPSLEAYEALALKLAKDPPTLAAIKQRLATNRTRCALFDTDRMRRHVEAAYVTIWERAQRGAPPESFAVTPMG
jgi:protein O-GlcNAc transferase